MNELERIARSLGEGWEVRYALPPPGISVLRDEYMAGQGELEELCSREEAPVIPYIVAEVEGGPTFVFGRVIPAPPGCRTAVFRRRFRRGPHAARALVEYAVKAEKVPTFQLNPLVVQFAGLCDEYPTVCMEPEEVVRRLEEPRASQGPDAGATSGAASSEPPPVLVRDLELLFRELATDPAYARILREILERPERLRQCYDG